MRRLTQKQYNRQSSIAMTAYVVMMMLVWPLVRTTPDTLSKFLLSVLPVLPMLYVIGLMARRIMSSDELQQRMHLIALGVATAVVGALSLIGGFLAAGKVVAIDGSILIWVFPMLLIVYGLTRWWVITRLYGGSADCEDGQGMTLWHRLLLLFALMAFIALVGWWRGDMGNPFRLGMLLGMGAGLLLVLVIALFRRGRGMR